MYSVVDERRQNGVRFNAVECLLDVDKSKDRGRMVFWANLNHLRDGLDAAESPAESSLLLNLGFIQCP